MCFDLCTFLLIWIICLVFKSHFNSCLYFNKPNSISFEKGCRKCGVKMSWTGPVCWTIHSVCHIIALLFKASNLVKEWKVITRYKNMPLCPNAEIYSWAQSDTIHLTHCPFIACSSSVVKTMVLGHCNLPMPFHLTYRGKVWYVEYAPNVECQ
jgi:hypothetical protein